jgi:hypothetical protein
MTSRTLDVAVEKRQLRNKSGDRLHLMAMHAARRLALMLPRKANRVVIGHADSKVSIAAYVGAVRIVTKST